MRDRVAIITGAGRGLGKAFALRFAAEGAKLLLPDISLERAAARCGRQAVPARRAAS